MQTHMFAEIAILLEPFVAVVACKRSFTGVSAQVLLQVVFTVSFVVTLSALVRFKTTVDSADMLDYI